MKTNHPPSPDALLAFDALARHGSFTAAADALGCAKSRVSQLVKQLELELGTVLVLRNTRRVALTEAGQRLAIHARQLREMLDRVRGDVGNVQDCVEGPLVISSASAFAQFLLVPILSELSNQYPGLEMQLQLQVENRLQDPVAEGLDFCVRTRNVYDDGLVAKPLGFMRETVYASPGYLAQAPRLEHPEDLCLHRVLYDSSKAPSETVEWALEKDGVYVRMPVRPVLSCNQYSPLVSGAVAGCGLALLPPLRGQQLSLHRPVGAGAAGLEPRLLAGFSGLPLPAPVAAQERGVHPTRGAAAARAAGGGNRKRLDPDQDARRLLWAMLARDPALGESAGKRLERDLCNTAIFSSSAAAWWARRLPPRCPATA
ncbi:LysR family transcriptional regulator [Chromobacterium haemolyticum]|nr:LysR family transcriptional regulator [Chromobacterium haemolyticum]